MKSTKNQKRKPNTGRTSQAIPTKMIRLPVPLVNKLLDLKKRKGLEFLYQVDIDGLFSAKVSSVLQIPLFESRIQAGSPSPADELMEGTLDLNEHLIHHKDAT